jgi:hypothetical protein
MNREAYKLKDKEQDKMSLLTLLRGPVAGHNLVLGVFFTTAAGVIVGFLLGQIIYQLLQ